MYPSLDVLIASLAIVAQLYLLAWIKAAPVFED